MNFVSGLGVSDVSFERAYEVSEGIRRGIFLREVSFSLSKNAWFKVWIFFTIMNICPIKISLKVFAIDLKLSKVDLSWSGGKIETLVQ